jgi:hypothetical protein
MRKVLLILLCVPLMFSCGEKANNEKDIKIKELENRIEELESNEASGRFQSVTVKEMVPVYGVKVEKSVTYVTDTKTGDVERIVK